MPPRSPERPPSVSAATSATPPNDTTTASRCRAVGCSTPSSQPRKVTNTGSVPNTSATVEALARFTAETNAIWFT